MTWENIRFKELNKGDVFRRGQEIFVCEGDAGAKSRMIGYYELEPVEKEPYCIDCGDDDCEHFEIEGVQYHRSLGDVDENDEIWEPFYAVRKRDVSNMNMKVQKFLKQ